MGTWGHGEMQRDRGAAAGRREVGARFIVHSCEEGAAEPVDEGRRPYLKAALRRPMLGRHAVPTLPEARGRCGAPKG